MTEQEEANTELFPGIWLRDHGVPMPCIRHDVAPCWRMDYCHKGQCAVRAAEQYTTALCSGGILLSRLDRLPHTERKCSQLYEGFSLLLSLSRLEQAIAETKDFFLGYSLSIQAIASQIEKLDGIVYYPQEKDLLLFEAIYNGERTLPTGELHLLVLQLLFWFNNGQLRGRGTQRASDTLLSVQQVAEFLTSHPETQLTQTQLARQFFLSLSELKRAFRDCYHMPLAAYQRRERMKKACRLLRETKLAVIEIAEAVGYKSHSQFSAAFRKTEGLSPTEYRNKE